jgi:suppressor for copper-sensitivity B
MPDSPPSEARLEMWKIVVLTWLVVALAAAPARAVENPSSASGWAETEHGAVRLIAAVEAVGDGATVPIGLEFRMNPGWHIYWRSPGDAGYPPRVSWSQSSNLTSAEVSWPAPRRFSVLDMETVGYESGVILPVEARLEQPGEPLALRATVDYLTCADICVPYIAELALDLPAGESRPSAFAHDLARARAKVPGRGSGHGLVIEGVRLKGDPSAAAMEIDLRSAEPLVAPDVFVEAPAPLAFSAPQIRVSADGRAATLSLAVFNGDELGRTFDGLPITLTVIDGERTLEHATVARAALEDQAVSSGVTAPKTETPLLAMLGVALLGGFILNLMPCVLPVLSMKLLAVVGHGGGPRRGVRAGFLAAASGILFSFMVLAGALVGLKAMGHEIGWGLQFQQPWFLTAMILILTLFACNLWGFFEVPLPRAFGLANERAGRVRGLAGHFLTGALATLLATPCSAPFLGAAIGFALSRGAAEIFAVFTAIAGGLALPYLIVAAFPAMASRLPKPGRWMITLRRAVGLALAGTAAWLVWVLAGGIGGVGASVVGGISTAVAILLIGGRWAPPRVRPLGAGSLAALAFAAFLVPADPPVGARQIAEGAWRPLEPERIPALVADGHTVFVNVTADWCLTCKVNDRLVLSRDPVRQRLAEDAVVAMQGDWTAPDDMIARYLAGFGRYGIPFDAVYGPALPHGEALPELLSAEIVEAALARASGQPGRR